MEGCGASIVVSVHVSTFHQQERCHGGVLVEGSDVFDAVIFVAEGV